MKALQFTIPVMANKTIITKEEFLPYFYPHLHRHNEVQLTWIIKGEGTLVANNNMHHFEENEIYWISANQPHLFKSDDNCFTETKNSNVHTLTIFFNTASQLGSFFDIPEVTHLKEFIAKQNCGFKIPAEMVKALSEKMLQVQQNAGVEQFLYFLDMLKIIASIEKTESLSPEVMPTQFKEDEGIRIANIFNYVMQNYTQQITLEEVSRLAYMTPQAFCRYFKKHTHHTLVSFVNQVRINEACKKLVEHKYESIASVAYTTGFNSITNFNRVFKSVTKKSPKEYIDSYFASVSGPGTVTFS